MPAERVVVVHDYLTQRGGAERVALAIMDAFPAARLLTSCYEPRQTFTQFSAFDVETLWLQAIPPFRRDPRLALPFLGAAFARHEVTDADLVICSSSGWAHAVRTTVPKIVYCHNLARWLYQPDDYLASLPVPARRAWVRVNGRLRRRDQRWATSADLYLANSRVVQERIGSCYGRRAELLFPPAGITPEGQTEPVAGLTPGFLLTISRARAYKNTELICKAVCGTPGERLVVVGSSADVGRSPETNITRVGRVRDEQLRWLYRNCAALIAFGREDFGLTPVEAYQFGKPVIALRAGGYLDSTVDHVTGIFVDAPTDDALRTAIIEFRRTLFDRLVIERHGQQFTNHAFATQLHAYAEAATQPDRLEQFRRGSFRGRRTGYGASSP